MVSKEYSMAYTEVLEILKYVPEEDVNKLPEDKLEFYKLNRDEEYDYSIDPSIELKEQKMSDITKAVLANLYRDYWASLEEREQILLKEKHDIEQMEKLKINKEDKDIISTQEEKQDVTSNQEEYPVNVAKESILKRIINFFKKHLSR